MSRALRAIVFLAALLSIRPLAGQTVEPAQPGGVVTVVTATEAAPGDSLRFTFDAAEGVRLFGAASGTVLADRSGRARVPLTVGVPPDALAGELIIGTLTFGAGRAIEPRALRVDVAARRDVSIHLFTDTVAVAPTDVVEVPFLLRNRGNVADTVAIEVEGPAGWVWHVEPEREALPPGGAVNGVLQLVPADRAAPGGEHRLRVRVVATDGVRSAVLTAAVVAEDPVVDGLAQVPGSIFIGSSSRDGGEPGVALLAGGQVGAGTRLSLALRHSPSVVPPSAFRGELAGPRLRFELEAERWRATAGDVFLPGDVFTGPFQQGRGGALSVQRHGVRGDLLVARPWSYAGSGQGGHLARVRSEVATPAGRLGIQLSSIDRRPELLPRFGAAGGGLTYGLRRGGHDLEAAAGIVRVRDETAARTGFAGSARYRGRWDRGTLSAELRTVPATTRRATSHGREAFVSGLVEVTPGLALTGWGFARSAPLVDGDPHPTAQGGSAGVQLKLPRDIRLDVTAGLRDADLAGDSLHGDRTRSARARLDVPVGRAAYLEADVDVGTVRGGRSRDFRNLRLGLRWHGAGQWGWLGVSRYDAGPGEADTRIDLSGSVRLRSVRVQGGLTLPVRKGFEERVSLWSGVEVPLTSDYDLLTGIDHTGSSADPTRLSLGIRRRVGVPLPLPRSVVVEGTVFEDRDGDRLRDPTEPPLTGIEVRFGALRTTTDDDGRFRFHERSEGPLRVPASALPFGSTVPAGVYLPTRGSVDIPVIRTAAIDLRIFLDRDGDGVHDAAESFAEGALVSVVDVHGRSRDGTTNGDGRIRFGNLEPGQYTVRVRRPGGGSTFEVTVGLDSGDRLDRTIAVPIRGREIRIHGASGGPAEPPTAARPPVPTADSAGTQDPPVALDTTARSTDDDGTSRRAWKPILFAFDNAELRQESRTAAAELGADLAAALRADPTGTVVITGHTDAIGAAEYNLRLSRARAETVAEALSEGGVPASRIQVCAVGETRPAATNASPEGRRQNRRVEVVVVPAGQEPRA